MLLEGLMIYKEQLERILQELIDRNIDLKDELQYLPEGDLYVIEKNGKPYFYERFPKRGNRKKEHRNGISKQPDIIRALARKRYILEATERITADIKALEKALSDYSPADENTIMESFILKYPEYADGIYGNIQSDEDWANSFERAKDFYEEGKVHTSVRGEGMRSKNEVYIASRLDHYKIPYRYEAKLRHPDAGRVPDFTIKRPRDGKIIYWEHIGRTTDGSYLSGNEVKLVEYNNVGIAPWDNLIITYDQSDGGINAKLIDALIQGWLL